VLDAGGEAVVDSAGGEGVGIGYSGTPRLPPHSQGSTGRPPAWTQEGRIALYVASPIVVEDRIVGVAYTSASTFSIRTLLRD